MKLELRNAWYFIPALIVIFVFAVFLTAQAANTLKTYSVQPAETSKEITFFSATTTSATSTTQSENTILPVDGAEKVSFLFSRAWATGGNSGSSKFEVECSSDYGSTWFDCPRLLLNDVNKTASSTVWITAATSTVVASLDIEHLAITSVRCQVVELTDGAHSCAAYAEY